MNLQRTLVAGLALLSLSACRTRPYDEIVQDHPHQAPVDQCETPPVTRGKIAEVLAACLDLPDLNCNESNPSCCASDQDKAEASPEQISAMEKLCRDGVLNKLDKGDGLRFYPAKGVTAIEFGKTALDALGLPLIDSDVVATLKNHGLIPEGDEKHLDCPPSQEFIDRILFYCSGHCSSVLVQASPMSVYRSQSVAPGLEYIRVLCFNIINACKRKLFFEATSVHVSGLVATNDVSPLTLYEVDQVPNNPPAEQLTPWGVEEIDPQYLFASFGPLHRPLPPFSSTLLCATTDLDKDTPRGATFSASIHAAENMSAQDEFNRRIPMVGDFPMKGPWFTVGAP